MASVFWKGWESQLEPKASQETLSPGSDCFQWVLMRVHNMPKTEQSLSPFKVLYGHFHPLIWQQTQRPWDSYNTSFVLAKYNRVSKCRKPSPASSWSRGTTYYLSWRPSTLKNLEAGDTHWPIKAKMERPPLSNPCCTHYSKCSRERDNCIRLSRIKLVSPELSEEQDHPRGASYFYEPLEDLRFLFKKTPVLLREAWKFDLFLIFGSTVKLNSYFLFSHCFLAGFSFPTQPVSQSTPSWRSP